jgi:FSR family fosmidomycin resistance protein-like MFS transporter
VITAFALRTVNLGQILVILSLERHSQLYYNFSRNDQDLYQGEISMVTLAKRKITQSEQLLGILTTGHLVNDFYSITLPFLLPTLIVAFDLSYLKAGFLTIATSLLSGFLQPVAGYLADKYAQRIKTIQLGFFAFSLGLIIAGFSVSYLMLLAAFFIFGLGQATFHAQSTNLVTREFPRTRGKSMGIHGVGGSIGNFSAPIVITSLITVLSWRHTVSILAIPGMLMIILLAKLLNDPPGAPINTKGKPDISGKLLLLTLSYGLMNMTYIGFLTFLPTYLVGNGSSLNQAGLINAIMLFVGFVAQPAGGFIYDKFGGRFVFTTSALLASAGLLLFSIDSNFPPIMLIIIIGAATQARFPVTLAMGSEIAKPESVGVSVGFVFGLSGVLASFTPAITGYAADSLGLQTSFLLLVVLAVLSLIVSFFLPKRQLKSSELE